MNKRFRILLGAAALLAASLPAHAGVSLDRTSQSIPMCPFAVTPSNLYRWVAPPLGGCDIGGVGPLTEVWEGSLGLVAGDNVDAVSANTTTGKNVPYHIYFSGDRLSMGMMGTPYNAEAVLNQASADIWRMNNLTVMSPLASLAACAPTAIGGTHALFRNQNNYDFISSVNAGVGAGGNQDNIDALELDDLDPSLDKFHDVGVYFSLDAGSPSLAGASPAAVFFTPVGGAPGIWATVAMLGLAPADEMDALVVWDRGVVGAPDPGMDLVLFSLAPGSPSLGGLSPAAIFVSDLTGFFCVYVQANTLGMRVIDNVDGLDVLP